MGLGDTKATKGGVCYIYGVGDCDFRAAKGS